MKRVLLILSFSFLVLTSYSQDFYFGPKVGATFSNLAVDGTDVTKGDGKPGLLGGAFLRLNFGGFFIQPEAYISTNGGGFNIEDGTVDSTTNYRFTRFDIPLLAGKYIGDVFRVSAGPVFSRTISVWSITDDVLTRVSDDFKDSSIGLQIGAGVDLGQFSLDLRYEVGLSDYNPEINIAGRDFSTDQRTNMWMLTVGYSIF